MKCFDPGRTLSVRDLSVRVAAFRQATSRWNANRRIAAPRRGMPSACRLLRRLRASRGGRGPRRGFPALAFLPGSLRHPAVLLAPALGLLGCAGGASPDPADPLPPTGYRTPGYHQAPHLEQIRAAEAWVRSDQIAALSPGAAPLGEGVRIGILDDGIMPSSRGSYHALHEFFPAPVDLSCPTGPFSTTCPIVSSGTFAPPAGLHGDLVAAVAAHTGRGDTPPGVAPRATLVSAARAVARDDSGMPAISRRGGPVGNAYLGYELDLLVLAGEHEFLSTLGVSRSEYLGSGASAASLSDYEADVINMSIGRDREAPSEVVVGSEPLLRLAMRKAAERGKILTLALGNEGPESPLPYPAAYAADEGIAGHAIAVGSLDLTARRAAAHSPPCGVVRDWCLYAPGEGISAGAAGPADGTSVAAPQVAGAAAVVMGAFPNKTGRQIVRRLLDTAHPLHAPGEDPSDISRTYGHGRLDLAEALAPQGALSVPSRSGARVPLAASRLLGAGGRVREDPALRSILAYDVQGFPFPVDLTRGLSAPAAPTPHEPRLPPLPERRAALGHGLSLAARPGRRDAPWRLGWSEAGPWSLSWARGDWQPASLHTLFPDEEQPFLAFASPTDVFSLVRDPAGGLRLHSILALGDSGRLASIGLDRSLAERARLSLSAGVLDERGRALGARGTGVFASPERARTDVLDLALDSELSPLWSGRARYAWGRTRDAAGAGPFAPMWLGGVSQRLSLGLTRREVFAAGDALDLTWTLPHRSTGRTLVVEVPTGEVADQEPSWTRAEVQLSPEGRERRFELGYRRGPPERRLRAAAWLRVEPNHEPDAAPAAGVHLQARVLW